MSPFNEHNIDDLFKKSFKHLPLEMEDSDEFWDNMQAEEKSDRKKPLIWWFLGFAILLLGAILGHSNYAKEATPQIANTSIQAATNTELARSKEQAQHINSPKDQLSTKKLATKTSQSSKSSKNTKFKTSNKQKTSPSSNNKQASSAQKQKDLLTTKNSNKTSKNIELTNQTKSFNKQQNPKPQTLVRTSKETNSTSNNARAISVEKSTAKPASIELLQPLSRKHLAIIYKPSEYSISPEKISKHKTNRMLHGIAIHGGVYGVYSQLAIDHDAAALFQSYDELVNPLSSFAWGLDYVLKRERFKCKAGLEWRHTELQYEYRYTATKRSLATNPEAFVLLEDNNPPLYFTADSYGSKMVETHELSRISIQSLHIPVSIAYLFNIDSKVSLGPTFGAALNLSRNYQGRYLASDERLMIATSGNPAAVVNTNIGGQFIAGIECEIALNKKTILHLSPSYRHNPQNLFISDYEVANKHHFWGSQIGITYYLSAK